MKQSRTKRYPRSCPICHKVWWTRFMDPCLTCGNPDCRREAGMRHIPTFKFVPWRSPWQRRHNTTLAPYRGR